MSATSADDLLPLDRFLHDLRTPLGVAHGYLRLIRDGRLPGQAQQEKALGGVSEALGRMTHLCDVAAGRSPMDSDAPAPSARAFVEALDARLTALGTLGTAAPDIPDSLRIATMHPMALVEAAAILIHALLPEGSAYLARLADDGSALCIGRSGAAGDTCLLALPLESTPA